MKTIEVQDKQILLDIVLQHYGTAEAMGEIMANNPGLENEPSAVMEAGRELGPFYPDIKLRAGLRVSVDDDSRLVKKTVVGKINGSVTTYMETPWRERSRK
ncbi:MULTISPECIES: hypothetical protein [Bacteroidales]|jgi:hypothetical protein|uniref:Uncharacterized protein n=2 Tax=Bacteroidales TaxID=171549 RepID=A0A4S2EH03_PARDI|nr:MULTISPECIES: hypothetical protein [Bacteroidales]RLT71154.1 hypothetical protein D7V92_02315 [Parabacteroides sp. CH2-D42-20]TGY55178.1 hypothetical protein E5342_15180 [Parabacteroides distasonis]DAQ05172.1 MAG TPA: hypothetical protein [Bacteriophage sp.]